MLSLSCFFFKEKQCWVESGLPVWWTQFKTTWIPPSSHLLRWVRLVCKTKSLLIAQWLETKVAWAIAWECICLIHNKKNPKNFTFGWQQHTKTQHSQIECVCVYFVFICTTCVFMSPLESLFTSRWPVWGSSSKSQPSPALSEFPQISSSLSVVLRLHDVEVWNTDGTAVTKREYLMSLITVSLSFNGDQLWWILLVG